MGVDTSQANLLKKGPVKGETENPASTQNSMSKINSSNAAAVAA